MSALPEGRRIPSRVPATAPRARTLPTSRGLGRPDSPIPRGATTTPPTSTPRAELRVSAGRARLRVPFRRRTNDGRCPAPDLPAALLRMADPIDAGRESRRLRTRLPDLGGRSLRGGVHRPGRRLLRGAGARRVRADHHRRNDHPPRGALLGVQLPGALEG